MPTKDYTEILTGIKAEWITQQELVNGEIRIFVELPKEPHVCPKCKASTSRVKGYYTRRIRHTTCDEKRVILIYRQRRYSCKCGHSFNEKASFASKSFQSSPRLRQVIFNRLGEARSYTDIADLCGVSVAQVIRVCKEVYIPRPQTLPPVISIDEFKGNAAGQRYQVIITDPANKRILDILPNRNTQEIIRYFKQFPRHIRNAVRFICMDMSLQFRSVVKEVFPKSTIIADRFHIYRLVEWAMERVRKAEQRYLAGVSRMFKANKRILQKPFEKLTENEFIKLQAMLRYSENLRHAYALKHAFTKVIKFWYLPDINWSLDAWLDLVWESNLTEFKSILRSFNWWRDEIVNALQYKYSNGFTEGCNNKIKVLKRLSYGLKNFDRFRNRILLINVKGGHSANRNVLPRCA